MATPSEFVAFYSWQATSPGKANRSLIHDALEKAAAELRKDDAITVEPVIDRDTAGVAGSPDIATTIFKKIEKASAFIADVSLVLHDEARNKKSPNPNVLIELGFAAHALGWDRIILVANTHFGEVEELPFDLRPKRVTRYDMGPDDKPANARNNLSAQLDMALRHVIALGHPTPDEPSLLEKARRAFTEVSKANNSSFAPVMVTSTIKYPGVSREEYQRRLNATLPLVGHMVSPAAIPDATKKLTGPCKGVVCHLTKVGTDGITIELPPEGATVTVSFDDVEQVGKHDRTMMRLRLRVSLVIPPNIYAERVRLEAE